MSTAITIGNISLIIEDYGNLRSASRAGENFIDAEIGPDCWGIAKRSATQHVGRVFFDYSTGPPDFLPVDPPTEHAVNLTLDSLVSTASTLTTVMHVTDLPALKVTMAYRASLSPDLAECLVTIQNTGLVDILDVVFKREAAPFAPRSLVCYDRSPPVFRDTAHCSILAAQPWQFFSANVTDSFQNPFDPLLDTLGIVGNPFASTAGNDLDGNPLTPMTEFDLEGNRTVSANPLGNVRCQFRLAVPSAGHGTPTVLPAGGSHKFRLWIGATTTQVAALSALGAVGAVSWWWVQASDALPPPDGNGHVVTTNTFMFAEADGDTVPSISPLLVRRSSRPFLVMEGDEVPCKKILTRSVGLYTTLASEKIWAYQVILKECADWIFLSPGLLRNPGGAAGSTVLNPSMGIRVYEGSFQGDNTWKTSTGAVIGQGPPVWTCPAWCESYIPWAGHPVNALFEVYTDGVIPVDAGSLLEIAIAPYREI